MSINKLYASITISITIKSYTDTYTNTITFIIKLVQCNKGIINNGLEYIIIIRGFQS